MKYTHLLSIPTPQNEPLSSAQVKNNAGGFVFQLDDWARLDRFLVLGADVPTYYQSARKLTKESAAVVTRCYAADPDRTIAKIVEVSVSGRAPKNDPAVFALAIGACDADPVVRRKALAVLASVCRTSTHLFQFVGAARALGRGWGRTLKRAVAAWYDEKTADAVAFQAIKYREREGFTHKRLLQTAHPVGDKSPQRDAVYRWICDKEHNVEALPAIIPAHQAAMKASGSALCDLIRTHRLPWEAIPTEAKTDPAVWRAMVPTLGLTALIRNLGNMSRIGAIEPLSDTEAMIVSRLGDGAELRKARVHPYAILQALAVYKAGRGVRGSGTWTSSQAVCDALDKAFYKAFANVVPTGKRHLIALDVSGSMGTAMIGEVLSAREASAAMAMVTMAVEPRTHIVGFTSSGHSARRFGGMWGGGEAGLTQLAISPSQRLPDVVSTVANLPFGGTDCSLPMLYAIERGLEVDAFVVMTDNETWAGSVHPSEALKRYRAKSGINAKLVVVGMTATEFSIADPTDAGMFDVVGFDASAPAIMADFIRGAAPASADAVETDDGA